MIDRLPFLLLFCLLSLAVAPLAAAQETAAVATKSAKVRGWLFPSGDKEPASLVLKLAGDAGAVTLASTKDGAVISNAGYEEVSPAGTVAVELKSGEQILSTQSLGLREDRHYTLVAWRENGRWQVKAFSDDPGPSNAADRPLRVLNFAEGRNTLVSFAGSAETQVAADSVQESRAPAKVTLVTVRVQSLDGGPPAQSSVEIDFTSAPCAYVAIGPDYRGRMRPRVIEGGPLPEESPATAGAGEAQQ